MAKKLETSIGIYFNSPSGTLQDVYDWLEKVEYFNIPRSHRIDDISLSIYIDIPAEKLSRIECGEHIPQDGVFNDVLISTHDCAFNTTE